MMLEMEKPWWEDSEGSRTAMLRYVSADLRLAAIKDLDA